MPKSGIKIGVIRKIRTADFEQLDVISELTEEIEWENEADRQKATDKVTKHLIDDFTKAYNAVVDSIGVKRSLGTAILTDKDKNQKVANVASDPYEDFDILD